MRRIGRAFYEQPTVDVAKALLGQTLVRRIGEIELAGKVVEVEAYLGQDDPASHAYRGRTPRNSVMFGEPGHSYVYFTYGNHYCLNITTEPIGVAGAVLLRALEPLTGIRRMMENRGISDVMKLTNGPGKLTQALRIDRELNGEDLVVSERLFLVEGATAPPVEKSGRVGITRAVERELRFFVRGSPFVSRVRPSAASSTNP